MKRPMKNTTRREIVACIVAAIAMAARGPAGDAVAAEPLQAQLRILDYNVFGFDSHQCERRARSFGHIVANAEPAYDIVALNEYYNIPLAPNICGSRHLGDALLCTGRYSHPDNRVVFKPDEGFPNGGLGLFTFGTICEFHERLWSFQDSADPRQGVIFARVALPNTTVTLDVYVVHTHSFGDGCDRCCHKEQLLELAEFIRTHSPRSGNPVIVMGDFNIGGPPACCGNPGYEDITAILGSPRDLWWEAHPCGDPVRLFCGDPIAECDHKRPADCHTNECEGFDSPPMDNCFDRHFDDVCTLESAVCNSFPAPEECDGWGGYTRTGCHNVIDPPPFPERIDYIFVLEDPAYSSSAFQVELVDARVVNWFVQLLSQDDFERIPVSDHLGLEATINIFGRSSMWVDAFQTEAGTGTSCDPFSSLEDAVAAVPAGDRILLRRGLYPERLIIDRPCRLESVAGVAIIGF